MSIADQNETNERQQRPAKPAKTSDYDRVGQQLMQELWQDPRELQAIHFGKLLGEK